MKNTDALEKKSRQLARKRTLILVGLASGFVGTGFSLGLSGCTLQPPGRESRLIIDLSKIPAAEGESASHAFAQENSSSAYDDPLAGVVGTMNVIAPSSAKDFDCMFVNIVGPGIARDPQDNEKDVTTEQALDLFRQGKSCTYLGIHSGRFSKGSAFTASLTAPSGAERYVQVIGVRDTRTGAPACGPEFLNETDSSSVGYFELSRARVDLFGDQSVTMMNQYDPAPITVKVNKKIHCGQVCAPFHSTVPDSGQYYSADSLASTSLYIKVPPEGTNRFLRSIRLNAKTTSGTGTFKTAIYTDSSGVPSGSTFSPDATVNVTATGTEYSVSMFETGSQYFQLAASTPYWIKIYQTSGSTPIEILGGQGGSTGDLQSCTTLPSCTDQSNGLNYRAYVSFYGCD